MSDPTEFLFLVIYKTLTHIMKVSARNKQTSNKKVIGKKPLTNLYEMNSSMYVNVKCGETLHLLSNSNEISPKSLCKTWNDHGEFEINWERSKNKIAENLFALASETHSLTVAHYLRLCYLWKSFHFVLPISRPVRSRINLSCLMWKRG